MVVVPHWVGISGLWPLLVLTPHRPVVHCRVQLEVFHCSHQQAPGSVLAPQLELCSRLECWWHVLGFSHLACRIGRVVRRWFLRYQLESNGEISGRNGKKLWNFLSFRKMTHFHSVSLFCLTLKSLLKTVEKWQIIKNRVKNSLYIKYHAIFGISTKKYYKMTCDTIIL